MCLREDFESWEEPYKAAKIAESAVFAVINSRAFFYPEADLTPCIRRVC